MNNFAKIQLAILTTIFVSLSSVAFAQASGNLGFGSGNCDNFSQSGSDNQNQQGQQQGQQNQQQGYSQQGCGGQGYSSSAQYQSGSGASAYTPTVIPNSRDDSRSNNSNEAVQNSQVQRSPSDNTTPQPLYARPGTAPGQFELYRRPVPPLNEFEKFVKATLGRPLPRFGSSLILTNGRSFATPSTTAVPPDYRLNPGDELLVGVTGSVEADLRLVIDSEGRVFVPKIGSIDLAGVRYGDLSAALSRRFNEQYKQVKVSVVIGRLHGITIYVTGYAVSPGAYTVSSLETMIDAVLAAGGPSQGGSFRSIELRRAGHLITTLDLYDLLLRGDKSRDAVLQNGDVLAIGPAGPEVAVFGSVNVEAIYEAKPGDTLGDVIRYAGGPTTLADESRVFVARLADADKTGLREFPTATAVAAPVQRGDIVRVISPAGLSEPLERQAVVVTIEGEVSHPGRYFLPPDSSVGDLVAAAGGLTRDAFVFGSKFERESVQREQQASFDRAIDDLELAAAAAPLSSISEQIGQAGVTTSRLQSSLAVIEQLRRRKPDGRLVLNEAPDSTTLPGDLKLESNDSLYVPARPKVVGVFGAVYQPSSFIFTPGTRISDYLKLAGGPQTYADGGSYFVVRANGSVVSHRHEHNLGQQYALPGDVIFMPVKASQNSLQRLLQLTTIIFQLGIGAAALGTIF